MFFTYVRTGCSPHYAHCGIFWTKGLFKCCPRNRVRTAWQASSHHVSSHHMCVCVHIYMYIFETAYRLADRCQVTICMCVYISYVLLLLPATDGPVGPTLGAAGADARDDVAVLREQVLFAGGNSRELARVCARNAEFTRVRARNSANCFLSWITWPLNRLQILG
jgi:hypothetical protein